MATHAKSFKIVSYDALDCRLRGIYNLISKNNLSKAAEVINDTIRTVNTAESSECCRAFLNYFVDNMYRILIDIARKQMDNVHNRLRDVHYMIIDIITPDNDVFYDQDISDDYLISV